MSLSASNVIVRHDDALILDGITLDVAESECLALVGESGAGKTTLLRCFNRMAEATQGEVRVAGQDVRTVDPVTLRRRIGYVPQEGGLLPHWSVERNAALVPWLLGDSAAIDRGRIALERVGLDPAEFGARRPSQLSGGQRQRVAVARAIAAGATTVLLDEPFGALDAITRRELHDLFGTLRRELAITALLVTHDLHEAFALADRIAVMRAGRIEQVGTPAQLRDTPASDYVGLLLGMARAG